MCEDNNIIYLVILDNSKIKEHERTWFHTTCSTQFAGYLINSNSNQTIFELNGSKALVIVPTNCIKWMAPLKPRERRNNGK